MEESLEELEDYGQTSGDFPQQFKTLTILSHIANGIWGFLFLISIAAFGSMGEQIIRKVPELRGYGSEAVTITIVVLLIILVLIVLSLVGVIMMQRKKKSGFVLYAVANGLWSVLLLMGLTPIGIITGLAGIGFIVAFSKHRNLMS